MPSMSLYALVLLLRHWPLLDIEMKSERRASVSHCAIHMGLAASELTALAGEGVPIKLKETKMDWLMKLMMGGWLPQGQRSQWMAFAVALGAMVTAFVQWGSGDMGVMELTKLLGDKWPMFVAAWYGYFMAEKVDAKDA